MSNELIGQYVQGEPAGFGGLFRLPRAVGGGVVLRASRPVDECSGIWAVDDVEWCPGGSLDVVLAVVVGGDEEFVEEELVEHAADVFGGLPVGVACVLGDVEGDTDEFVGFGEVGGEVAEVAVGGGQFGVEALMLGAEHVDGDRVVVVGFEELALATLDGLLRGLELFSLEVGVGAKLLQSVPEECFEVAAELGRETDAVVEILDQVLGVFDLDGAEGAVGALGVASEA
ncbi:hypothetical protein [Brevibacterium casei]